MIPTWLAHRIGDTHRAAGLRTCPRCGAPILTGLDNDTAALTARADPTPLTPLGETLALLAGRPTYNLTTTSGRKELHRRDEWHIKGERRYPVIPAHKCGAPLTQHMDSSFRRARYVCPPEPPY